MWLITILLFSVAALPSPPALFGSFHRASEPPQFVPLLLESQVRATGNPIKKENQGKFKENKKNQQR
jgi:hypothetical protein